MYLDMIDKLEINNSDLGASISIAHDVLKRSLIAIIARGDLASARSYLLRAQINGIVGFTAEQLQLTD